MEDNMNVCCLRVPYRVLVEALHLPKDAKIVKIDGCWDQVPYVCSIYVEHPSAPELIIEFEHCPSYNVEKPGDFSRVF